ncbi:hypothetical protein SNE40_019906 [Patella caerulea]|uniref:Bcl-2 Bcl-2 homology region 1-3 domain-containing protein n=1 Tax=Patella caerulea TaxID=87958 RepID=A0AAN8IY11_PATCE
MNWGRICMLLFFGYRMAISVLRTHFNQFSDFLGRITQYVVRFIVRSKIAKWIADHGGWRGALSFVPSSTVGQVIFVGGLACVSVLAVFYFNSN